MDFFIGAISTLISVLMLNRFILKYEAKTKIIRNRVRHTQSSIHDSIGPLLNLITTEINNASLDTQATRFYDSRHITVAFSEDKAYWIQDNALLCAELIDGEFDKESGKRVDTMAMNDVELKKIDFIVEQLTEAKRNDLGNTGNSHI